MVLTLAQCLDGVRLDARLIEDGHDLAGRRAHVLVEWRTLTMLLLEYDSRALPIGSLIAEGSVSFALESAHLRNVDSLTNETEAANTEHLTEVEVVLDVLLQADLTPVGQLVAEAVVSRCRRPISLQRSTLVVREQIAVQVALVRDVFDDHIRLILLIHIGSLSFFSCGGNDLVFVRRFR